MRIFAAALLAALSAHAEAAIGYRNFSPPGGGYAVEYPADWKLSYGLQAIGLQAPGKEGALAKIYLELYPLGKGSPATPEKFVDQLLKKSGSLKKVESRSETKVAGKTAQRLVLVETRPLKGDYGQVLPGPMKEVYLLIPAAKKYYVLRLEGIGKAFEKSLPEFERMAGSLQLMALK